MAVSGILQHLLISIHALREEGDPAMEVFHDQLGYFYPRPPRGGRPRRANLPRPGFDFYPRPPRGGRLCDVAIELCERRFLSTPSARRATFGPFDCAKRCNISIHALREEGDAIPEYYWRKLEAISIHALREEGAIAAGCCFVSAVYFYPRPPRGGRPVPDMPCSLSARFLSTPSARRAT